MESILKKFTNEPLFDACATMLGHLHIKFNEVTREPIPFESLYPTQLPVALKAVLDKVNNTYFVGTVDEESLAGNSSTKSADEVTDIAEKGKYIGMMIFAVHIKEGQSLTRTESATLTRGFNRIAAAQPVVLFIKQENTLALSTCERSNYSQAWRDGEKLGKVSILRGIDCNKPHRAHIDILESIGDKEYPSFEELYLHWKEVFSSELLTKKFYNELSDWYAWAVQVARFPNDLKSSEDDDKFNHESCIRLITRLIFVWFLKQKHLIPEEFFDEKYIKENFIEEFNPHDRKNLLYNAEESKYYRAILQNLFFAMLNCPIVAEGKDTPNNRRFRGDGQFGYKREGYNINNLMRYKNVFMEGGADKFVQIANSSVPFLNGGLFDCLDNKSEGLYYDGFSERKESLEQLYLPDWLFFGEEVGAGIDLSKWYDDIKKKNVSARGIIDILKRYSFTIEENTPLDQEVSLDPELLGKVFENLLAAYNPETKSSARKQTGSFYTPREIVQYMVNESLVAHLKRICGDEMEPKYRALLDYSTNDVELTKEQKKSIMTALYNCRVLDPACGSGAFPMGILQQMVHVLKRIDPSNEMWNNLIIDFAIEQARIELERVVGDNEEKERIEEERKVRLADIEEAFNTSINDPDYARKLYLIEHCIYGVDIQPIATQISKLRFFISLVVDQKPTSEAKKNFGIRPLPNLESKFVAANTLIPVEYDSNLVDSNPEVHKYKEKLKVLNHRIFLAKRNVDKQRFKNEIKDTREKLAKAIENTGFVSSGAARKLSDWDMFDQNSSASFFDSEWMFGVKDGFDVVIANPPYVEAKKLKNIASTLKSLYTIYSGTADLSIYFVERGINLLVNNGILTYITTNKFFNTGYGKPLRRLILCNEINQIINFEQVEVFENVLVSSVVLGLIKNRNIQQETFTYEKFYKLKSEEFKSQFINRDTCFGKYPVEALTEDEWSFADAKSLLLKAKIERGHILLGKVSGVSIFRGVTTGYNPAFIIDDEQKINLVSKDSRNKSVIKNLLQGRNVRKWFYNESNENLIFTMHGFPIDEYPSIKSHLFSYYTELKPREEGDKEGGRKPGSYEWYEIQDNTAYYLEFEKDEKIIWGLTADKWAYTLDTKKHYLPSNGYILTSRNIQTKYILGLLNSNVLKYYFGFIGVMTAGGAWTLKAATISALPFADTENRNQIIDLVDSILKKKDQNHEADISEEENLLNLRVYHIYKLTYDEVLIIDPEISITRDEYENINDIS